MSVNASLDSAIAPLISLSKGSAGPLARMADCSTPVMTNGWGASYLDGILASTLDAIVAAEGNIWHLDPVRIADSVVPVAPQEVWAIFNDLAAWDLDLNDYVPAGVSVSASMLLCAQRALRLIAESLIAGLLFRASLAQADAHVSGPFSAECTD